MKVERPRFELTRVYSDGTQEVPEIVSVAQMPWDTKMSRRGVLGVGLTVTGVLALLSGCNEKNIFTSQTAKETDIQDSPDVQRKSPTTVLKAHKQNIVKLIFSADSANLVSASQDSTVKQWAMPDGNLVGTVSVTSLSKGSYSHLGLSPMEVTPDGKTLIANLDKDLGLWSLPQGNLLKKIPSDTNTLGSIFKLSPDGKVCALAGGNTIKLFSVPEGELLTTLTGDSQKNVMWLTFAPNGKILISGATDEEFKIWSVPDGKLSGKLAESRYFNFTDVNSIAASSLIINPESNILAINYQGQLRFWSLPNGGKIEKTIKDNSIQTPALTLDGKMLITTGKHYPTPGTPSPSPSFQSPPPNSYPMPIATPFVPTAIKLWSFPEMELQTIGKIKDPYTTVTSLAKMVATPDGKMLAVAFHGRNDVWLVSLPDLKLESVLKGNISSIAPIFAFSPDGKYLAMGDLNGTIMLWDLQKREFLAYLFDKNVNKSSVKGVAYNVKDKVTGRTITYTLPCGSPIPPGAVCTCNCVPGVISDAIPARPKPRPKPPRRSGGFSYCTCNKICTCIPVPSDRNVKESFETTDATAILQRLSELPINKWNYKWDDESIRHIGPMAQDFMAAFAVGDSDKHIHPVDANGVAFAAIQGLYQMLKAKEAETESLKIKLNLQQEDNKSLQFRVENLEKLVREQFK